VRIPFKRASFGAVLLAGLLAACRGVTGYTPPSLASQTSGSPTSLSPDKVMLKCSAPGSKVPGTYIMFGAVGNVKGSTFTSNSTYSNWLKVHVVASPSPKPTPTPRHAPWYYYFGTFALKSPKKEEGCATLATTISGKPIIKGLSYNAFGDGVPKYEKTVRVQILEMGQLSEVIHGLGKSGGSGTLTLTLNGKGYGTGSVTLVGRVTLK
jgi:hypothetical protein